MYKSNTELIVIDAKATEPIPTNVVFWSHDKGTAKMIFELQKNHVDQSLATGTKVPILLEFDSATAENGRGKHTYFATIEDAVNGIVSIVLEDNILGYQGRVDGSIYIELPDSRSLDTAGRFTFHIKRSPIDEDVPELEDYYWQGFNEIMNQYHGTIATIKFEAKTLLDSLSADVTKVKNDIATANTSIDEINKKIDDNDVFTKAESSANVIYQVVGKEKVSVNFTINFNGKKSGSVAENPNIARHNALQSLTTPENFGGSELSDTYYDLLQTLDERNFVVAQSNVDRMSANLLRFNLIEEVKRFLGEGFFANLGLSSSADQLNFLRGKVFSLTPRVYARGSYPAGYRASLKVYFTDAGIWSSAGSYLNETTSIKELSWKALQPSIKTCIRNDGFVNFLVHAEASDGVTASMLYVDYASLDVEIELSANEYIQSMIAANHVENLATQTEATTATDNTKTMTPLRTKQLLDSKLLNMVYPIGSVYLSVNSATPATLFGGTWERFSKGRVLVGVDESDTVLATSGKQGGSTNPLTTHTHTTQLTTYRVTSTGSGAVNNLARSTDQGNAMTGEFGSVTSSGDNTDHKNWQPFDTVYIWKRTA